MLHIILFCTVFLFAHTYLKNASLTRYLLVTVPVLIIGMFGIDIALSLTEKKNSICKSRMYTALTEIMLQ